MPKNTSCEADVAIADRFGRKSETVCNRSRSEAENCLRKGEYMDMESKIRRLEDNLITIGTGVVLFAVWAVVKYILTLYSEGLQQAVATYQEEGTALYVISYVFMMFDFLLRCFIGFSARAEGIGEKKGNAYIILACVLFLVYFLSVLIEAFFIIFFPNDILYLLITIFIDATSVFFTADLIFSAVSVRKLRKQKEGV